MRPRSGRGKVNGTCAAPRLVGPDCNWRTCLYDCSGRGACYNGTCHCEPGYGGRDCSTRAAATGCQCATRCVRGCLDQCTTVFDTKGAAVAHGCYLKCTSECVRGCDGGDSDVESVAKRAAARALLA